MLVHGRSSLRCGVMAVLAGGVLQKAGHALTWMLRPSCCIHWGCVALCCECLQRLLLEMQSAVAMCPTAVPQLLEALEPQQMQHLSTTLLQLTEQQQQQQHLDCAGAPDHAAAVFLGQQLRHLAVTDVLLLISLADQQQWAADVSLVLMHGVLEAGRWVSWCTCSMCRRPCLVLWCGSWTRGLGTLDTVVT